MPNLCAVSVKPTLHCTLCLTLHGFCGSVGQFIHRFLTSVVIWQLGPNFILQQFHCFHHVKESLCHFLTSVGHPKTDNWHFLPCKTSFGSDTFCSQTTLATTEKDSPKTGKLLICYLVWCEQGTVIQAPNRFSLFGLIHVIEIHICLFSLFWSDQPTRRNTFHHQLLPILQHCFVGAHHISLFGLDQGWMSTSTQAYISTLPSLVTILIPSIALVWFCPIKAHLSSFSSFVCLHCCNAIDQRHFWFGTNCSQGHFDWAHLHQLQRS